MSSSSYEQNSAPIIARTPVLVQRHDWQQALAEAFHRAEDLLAFLDLPAERLGQMPEAVSTFPLRVPRGFAALMKPGDWRDPLLRQVLPLDEELVPHAGFVADPVGDLAASRSDGVLQKYQGRALLIASGACAVHCRYCFRRHYPYQQASATPSKWNQALGVLAEDDTIEEVILSGGDPLMLQDEALGRLLVALAAIPHLKRLRIHTRLPVVIPERITGVLPTMLASSRLTPVMVLHINHPNEIGESLRGACARMRLAGITLLNQSVLLRGVNDSTDTLQALSTALFYAGILPYYLHMLDPVAGAAHFDVDEIRAAAMLAELRERLPGYLLPRLVREYPGRGSKTPIPNPETLLTRR